MPQCLIKLLGTISDASVPQWCKATGWKVYQETVSPKVNRGGSPRCIIAVIHT